ncbi:hypothetical protein PR048_031086 [Dryococelus australis]|uniref:Uncharacterized protein n=1 Tax=Dryococelus australis TaxID=614101 RepID=A0ABQ9G5F1_9NEOP|nr:hypothetical protein PR048_031086 [Dryococelus australis]
MPRQAAQSHNLRAPHEQKIPAARRGAQSHNLRACYVLLILLSCGSRLFMRISGALYRPLRACSSSREHLKDNQTKRKGETGDPRENPPTNGIVRHDSHLRKSVDPAGIEPGSPWREASVLTALSQWPLQTKREHDVRGGLVATRQSASERVSVSRAVRRSARKASTLHPLQGDHDWESCRMMPLVGGFSRGSPVSPAPSFRCRSIFTSITRIGSQDLDFTSTLSSVLVNLYHPQRVKDVEWSFFGRFLATRSREPMKVKRGEREAAPECSGRGKREIPEENPLTGGMVRQYSHLRKTGMREGGREFDCHVGIVPDAATGRRVFSVYSRSSRICIPTLLHAHLITPSIALISSIGAGNESVEETEDPRENPPTNGIVRHDSHMPGIELGSPWWEASVLIAQPLWPQILLELGFFRYFSYTRVSASLPRHNRLVPTTTYYRCTRAGRLRAKASFQVRVNWRAGEVTSSNSAPIEELSYSPIPRNSHPEQRGGERMFTGHAKFALLFGTRLNSTVLFILDPPSFPHWLLTKRDATPLLTELHVIRAHNWEVSSQVWSNDKPTTKVHQQTFPQKLPRWRSGYTTRLPPHQGEPGSIPGGVAPLFSHVGIVADHAADRRVFLGISRFPRHHSGAAPYSPRFTLIGSQASKVVHKVAAIINSDCLSSSRGASRSLTFWFHSDVSAPAIFQASPVALPPPRSSEATN